MSRLPIAQKQLFPPTESEIGGWKSNIICIAEASLWSPPLPYLASHWQELHTPPISCFSLCRRKQRRLQKKCTRSLDQTKLFTETCWSSFSKLNASSVCCPSSHQSQIYPCQHQPQLNCDRWEGTVTRKLANEDSERNKAKEAGTINTAWKWTSFATERGFWREVDERCGVALRWEVALVCKGSFWQLFDLTGFKWLDLFAKGEKKKKKASFWWYTHKTLRGFI